MFPALDDDRCPVGFTRNDTVGSCYLLCHDVVTVEVAASRCSSMNSKLLEVESPEESVALFRIYG